MVKRTINFEWKIGLLITIGLSILGAASRIFDRTSNEGWTLFQKTLVSDGRYYLYQSERFRGQSIYGAIDRVNEVFSGESFGLENLSNGALKIIETRPLYPLLTSFFGPGSAFTLMIVPISSWVIIHLMLYFNLSKFFSPKPVLIILSIISCSFYFRYNLLASTTDALALLLIIPYLYICVLNQISVQNFIVYLFTIFLGLLTRPIAPLFILTSLIMVFLAMNLINKLFHLAVVVISSFHLLYLQVFKEQITIQANANGSSSALSIEYIFHIIANFPRVIIVEFAFLATNDTLIFILLIVGFLYSILLGQRYKSTILSIFVACFTLGAVNGTIGNGFRYQLPLVIVILPSLISLVERVISNKSDGTIGEFPNDKM